MSRLAYFSPARYSRRRATFYLIARLRYERIRSESRIEAAEGGGLLRGRERRQKRASYGVRLRKRRGLLSAL